MLPPARHTQRFTLRGRYALIRAARAIDDVAAAMAMPAMPISVMPRRLMLLDCWRFALRRCHDDFQRR